MSISRCSCEPLGPVTVSDSAQNRRCEIWTESDHPVVLRRDSRCDSACGWLRMACPSGSRSRSGDSGAKCSSGVAFAKATILTRIALDARFPNKSESAFGVEAGLKSSSESLKIVYCDRPFCEDPLARHVKPCTVAPDCQESRWASTVPIG